MASIRKVIELGASPDAVWDALADFQAVHERVAQGFVTSSRPAGEDRVVTFAPGGEAQERLVTADAAGRRLVYTVVRSGLGATHHQASAEVHESTDGTGGSRLVWITDVLPDDLGPVIDGLMDEGAVAIARTLAG
jgi:Polyketide cyclase / dehydrase and lipid transport